LAGLHIAVTSQDKPIARLGKIGHMPKARM
jgi:hypothetical protein